MSLLREIAYANAMDARDSEIRELKKLIAEIRFYVKCDPQMDRVTYSINRTGVQAIGQLLATQGRSL